VTGGPIHGYIPDIDEGCFRFWNSDINYLHDKEPHLRRTFGVAYLEYCKSVPKWIPKLRRRE